MPTTFSSETVRLLASLRAFFVICLAIGIPIASATAFVMIMLLNPNGADFSSTLLVVANLIGPVIWLSAYCSALDNGLNFSPPMGRTRDQHVLNELVNHAFHPVLWVSYVVVYLIIKNCAA